MSKTITIYWNARIIPYGNEVVDSDLLFSPPKPLLPYLKDKLGKALPFEKWPHNHYDPPANYLQCPAATRYLKNIFIIENPIDFTIQLDSSHPTDPVKFHSPINHLVTKSVIDQFYALAYFHNFFTEEEDLMMDQLSPSFHFTEFSRYTTSLQGGFNIGRWFRGTHPNFIMHYPTITSKKGEALNYVKFNTDKKIIFKHYTLSPLLTKLEKDVVTYKHKVSRNSLYKLYDIFASKNLKKRVLKEIKANLTGY